MYLIAVISQHRPYHLKIIAYASKFIQLFQCQMLSLYYLFIVYANSTWIP